MNNLRHSLRMGLHIWDQTSMHIATMTVNRKPPDFRDIRSDLRVRIESLEKTAELEQADFTKKQEKAAADHRKAMDGIRTAIDGYRKMLLLEEAMAENNMLDTGHKVGPPIEAETKIPLPVALPSLADFLINKLVKEGPLSKEELRQAAQMAGYFGDFSGGRATHATLENIKRSKRVFLDEEGKFRASEMEKALL